MYNKVRENHEKKVHSLDFEECGVFQEGSASTHVDKTDDVYNYCTAKLNLGLLLRNADDSVKEGHRERIIWRWKFILLYFKAYGHHTYAYAALLLQARLNWIYTEAQAEQLIWNKTVNKKGGKELNISCHLGLEQVNCLTKELLHNWGVNFNEVSAKRESMAIGFLEKILETAQNETFTTAPSGHHKKKTKETDLKHLVENLSSRKIFDNTIGRQYEKLRGFNRNLLAKLTVSSLSSWLTDLLKKFSKKYPS
eukprot:gene13098-14439_t